MILRQILAMIFWKKELYEYGFKHLGTFLASTYHNEGNSIQKALFKMDVEILS